MKNKGLRDIPRSMPTNDNFRANYDAIFKKEPPQSTPAPTSRHPEEGPLSPDEDWTHPPRLPRRG